MKKLLSVILLVLFTASFAFAQPKFMDVEFAAEFCELWNKTETLTEGLGLWSTNTKDGKDFRTIQFYREDCSGVEKAIEVKIVTRDEKAICVSGGKAVETDPDFLMYATDKNWNSLARGEFGFLGVGIMMKMTFVGSKIEAMTNMGPFKALLLNLGKVSHTDDCP